MKVAQVINSLVGASDVSFTSNPPPGRMAGVLSQC